MVLLRRPMYLAFALASVCAVSASPVSAHDEIFNATGAIPLPGGQHVQSFDISFVDPLLGIYILGDRTNSTVDVIDTGTNSVLTQLAKGNFAGAQASNDISGPNGVLVVRHREVWAGDAPCGTCTPASTDSTVKVIDLFNQKLTQVIHTGGKARADEMCWDPRHQKVAVANNADDPPFVSIIDTQTYQVVNKIVFGPGNTSNAPVSNNGIEQCQWDKRTGMFYITVPGIVGQPAHQGGVAVINPTTGMVLNTYILPVALCDTPQGMAVGPEHQILIGCNGSTSTFQSSVIIDDRNGKIFRRVANESGPDEVWYNPGDGHYFLARSGAPGLAQLLGVIDAEFEGGWDSDNPGARVVRDQDVVTANKSIAGRNAHSVAADAVTNQVYVPIPAGVSTICGLHGNGAASDANGCIGVFTAPNSDRPEAVANAH